MLWLKDENSLLAHNIPMETVDRKHISLASDWSSDVNMDKVSCCQSIQCLLDF